jgi:hypothetical protein
VSSLWTPGGEHDVPRTSDADGVDDLDDLEPGDEEELEDQVRAELADARRRLAEVPVEQVVANHAMGLFELAAIHLGVEPPHVDEARLAIDALGAIVDGVGDRLGDAGPVLRDALAQIRLAFVQVSSARQ